MIFRYSHGLVAVAVVLGLGGCSSKKGPRATIRGAEDTVAFSRSNAQGGRDLWLVAISGGSDPRRVTDLDPGDRVTGVLEETAGNHIVFGVQSGGTENLWVVPKNATLPQHASQLTHLTGAEIDELAVVADRWLVMRLGGGEEGVGGGPSSLWSIAADTRGTTSPQRLSSPAATDVRWDSDWVTDDGWVVFRETRLNNEQEGESFVVSVDPSNPANRHELSRSGATQTTVLAVEDESAVMAEFDPISGDRTFTAANAASGGTHALSPPIPDAELDADGIVAGNLWYVRRDPGNGVDNLFAARLDGSDAGMPRNLSHLSSPSSISAVEFSSDGSGVFVVNRAPPEPARIFSTDLSSSGDVPPTMLTDDGLHVPGSDFIDSLTRVGTDRVVYAHGVDGGKVWGATLGVAGSEDELGSAWTDAEIHFEDRDVFVKDSSGVAFDRVIVRRRSGAPGEMITNFYGVQPNGDGWQVLPLTTDTQPSDDDPEILARRGSRLVFMRRGTARSVDPTVADSEITISDNSMPLNGLETGDRGIAEPYVFFITDTRLASASAETAQPGGVRALHVREQNQQYGGIEGVTNQYIVFTIETFGQSMGIWSSPLAPGAISSKELSRPVDTFDVFLGMF